MMLQVVLRQNFPVYWWNPDDIFNMRYGYIAVYDVVSSHKEKFQAYSRKKALVSIQSKLPPVDIGEVDRPIWVPAKGSIYTS